MNSAFSVELKLKDKLGEGAFGFKRSVALCGLTVDQLISGLQKYIRRGEKVKAVRCGVHLGIFGLMPKSKYPKAHQIVSNLWNRLLLIASEDVCTAAPGVMKVAWDLYRKGNQNRNELIHVIQMVSLLADLPKIRKLSDLGAMYWRKEGYEWSMSQQEYKKYYKLWDINNCGRFFQKLCQKTPGIEQTAKSLIGPYGMDTMAYALFMYIHGEQDLAFLVAGKFFANPNMDKTVVLKKAIYRSRKPINLAWYLICEYNRIYMNNKYLAELRALFSAYKERKHPLFFYHALAYVVHRNAIPKNFVLPTLAKPAATHTIVEKCLANPTFVLNDYCIDKHTAKGRALGKNNLDFALEGAVVCNEDKSQLVQDYRDSYIKQKELSVLKGTKDKKQKKQKKKNQQCTGEKRKKAAEEEESQDPKKPVLDVSAIPPPKKRQKKNRRKKHKQKEEEYFEHAQRITVLTGKRKKDVKAAVRTVISKIDGIERKQAVVYKGPYLTRKDIEPQLRILEAKKCYSGIHAVPEFEVVKLIPTPGKKTDNPPDFGSRYYKEIVQNRKKAYYFLVMTDLCKPKFNFEPYPTRAYGKSGKKWPASTPLAVNGGQHLRMVDLRDKPELEKQLLLAGIWRYVWGVIDTCPRNFLFVNNKVYSIDEEDCLRNRNSFYKTLMSNDMKVAFISALGRHWHYVIQHLKQWETVPNQPFQVYEKIQALIQDLASITKVF